MRSLLAIAALLFVACGPVPKKQQPDYLQVPDFRLPDVNPASPRATQEVSPRDYVGKVSAWYFGLST